MSVFAWLRKTRQTTGHLRPSMVDFVPCDRVVQKRQSIRVSLCFSKRLMRTSWLCEKGLYSLCEGLFTLVIEVFCAKSAYIAFLGYFHFLQDRANFWQTDFFWHEKHSFVIVLPLSICALFSRNNVCRKTQFCQRHLYERISRKWLSNLNDYF